VTSFQTPAALINSILMKPPRSGVLSSWFALPPGVREPQRWTAVGVPNGAAPVPVPPAAQLSPATSSPGEFANGRCVASVAQGGHGAE